MAFDILELVDNLRTEKKEEPEKFCKVPGCLGPPPVCDKHIQLFPSQNNVNGSMILS